MDLSYALERYLHRSVAIVTSDRMRLQGVLASVTDGCVRLTNVKTTDAIESVSWYEQIQHDESEPAHGPRWPEILIQIHYISAVTCLEDDILDLPFDDGTKLPEPLTPPQQPESQPEDFLPVDLVTMEIGTELIKLAKPEVPDNLLNRIKHAREQLAATLGILLPKVRVMDNLRLSNQAVRIMIRGNPVAQAEILTTSLLAIPRDSHAKLKGIETIDPTFGVPAIWIDPAQRAAAHLRNCTVLEPVAVITTLYLETMRRHADELLTYDIVQRLLQVCRESHPTTVDTLYPAVISLPTLHEILRRLLEEKVSIRNLAQILESLGRHLAVTNSVDELLALVRVDLTRTICNLVQNAKGQIEAILWEEPEASELASASSPLIKAKLNQVSDHLAKCLSSQNEPFHDRPQQVLVVDAKIRRLVWAYLHRSFPNLFVLCREEIHPQVDLVIIDELTLGAKESAISPAKKTTARARPR